MPSPHPCGTLLISIDLEHSHPLRRVSDHRTMDDVVRRLSDLLSEQQIAATWCVADPAVSAATEHLLAQDSRHEMAILGDSTWVGKEAGRKRFANELTRRTLSARAAGLTATTLALQEVELDDHLDLLVKHGISAIRPTTGSKLQGAAVSPLRYGLWSLAPSARISGGDRSVLRLMRRACAGGETFHLVIDAPGLAKWRGRFEGPLRRSLKHAANACREGRLTITTLSGLTEQLAQPRATQPAHSILRPAA